MTSCSAVSENGPERENEDADAAENEQTGDRVVRGLEQSADVQGPSESGEETEDQQENRKEDGAASLEGGAMEIVSHWDSLG